MPDLGAKCRGSEIGKGNSWYFWTECPICEKQRWVTVNSHKYAPETERKGLYRRCFECSKKRRAKWLINPKQAPTKVFE